MSGTRQARPRVPVWIGGGFALVFATLFARVVWHIGDEGSVVYNAQRWAQGGVPYRDFFEVMGPLTFAPGAIAFRILGVSWWASRIEMIAAIAVTGFLAAQIASRVVAQPGPAPAFPSILYVAVVVPLWPGVNYHLDSNAAYLACVALALGGKPPSRLRLVSMGVLTALVALIMLQKGALLALVLSLRYALDRRVPLATRAATVCTVLLSAAAVVGSVWIYFAAHGALHDLIYATLIWPATQYHVVNRVTVGHGLGELFATSSGLWTEAFGRYGGTAAAIVLLLPVLAVPVLAAVGLATVAWRAFRQPLPDALHWRVVAGAGIALLVSELHRPDIMHLLYGAPLLMVLGWACVRAHLRTPGYGAVLAILRVSTIAMIVASGTVALSASTVVTTPVGTVHRHGSDPVLEFLRTDVRPCEAVFVYPYYPMYYFLGGIRNPTRYSIFMYGINTPKQAQEIIRSLEARNVRLVLWDTVYSGSNLSRWFRYTPPHPDAQAIERYLAANYVVDRTLGGYKLLRRIE